MTKAQFQSALLVATMLVPLPAFAQNSTDSGDTAQNSSEIVVTAQRRQEALLDVPITVSTLSAEQLENANIESLSGIAQMTPGLRFDYAGAFYQPTIRGIGTSVTTSGGGSNVGIYVDGFYSPNPLATNMQLMKLRSVQVLKGPQGTLFGRNTTGGAILLQTDEPRFETGGEVKLSYGRDNDARAQAYFTTGITQNIAFDIEGLYSRGDGWRENISTGEEVGDFENWSVRLGVLAEISDDVSFLLRYQHGDIDDPNPMLAASYTGPDIGGGQPFFAAPGEFTHERNEIAGGSLNTFVRSKSDVVQGTLRANLGFADFASYTQFRRERTDMSQDLDYSGLDLFQLGLPNRNKTWSQEFILNSKPGTRLQWTAGLFYFENTDRYITFIDNFRVGNTTDGRIRLGGSSTKTKSYAAFADATYEVSPQFFITAGLRYAKDKVVKAWWNPQYSDAHVDVPSISNDQVTPRIVLRYKPDDQWSIYGSYTKGYKAAIIDVGGSCQVSPFICNDVRPEKVDAFEVGVKHDGGALSFEASAFYYDYKNLQVSMYRSATAEIVNAAKSRIYGLDGQLSYRVSDALRLNVAAAWTHARYRRFNDAPIYTPCPDVMSATDCIDAGGYSFVIVPTDLNNVTMQRTPEFTGNAGFTYNRELHGGEFMLTSNIAYTSKFYFGPSGVQFPQKGYETLTARASWTDPSDTYTIAIYGNNLTNRRYKTQVQYSSFGIGANWNRPISYGVELGAKF